MPGPRPHPVSSLSNAHSTQIDSTKGNKDGITQSDHQSTAAFLLQNRVSELYSLVRFLRIFPYAYYFCNTGRSKSAKKAQQEPCTCKSLDYSFKTNWRKCDHCGCVQFQSCLSLQTERQAAPDQSFPSVKEKKPCSQGPKPIIVDECLIAKLLMAKTADHSLHSQA